MSVLEGCVYPDCFNCKAKDCTLNSYQMQTLKKKYLEKGLTIEDFKRDETERLKSRKKERKVKKVEKTAKAERAEEIKEAKRVCDVPIYKKLTITCAEASAYTGIGEYRIREIAAKPNCPFSLSVGNRTLIKRTLFEKWIEKQLVI